MGIAEGANGTLELRGVGEGAIDEWERSALQLVASSTDPRMVPLKVANVHVAEKVVVVARIDTSWRKPHMVRHQGTTKFWIRRGNQKGEMNAQELREAFLSSESAQTRPRRLRDQRIAESVPLLMGTGTDALPPCLIIHIVPIFPAQADVVTSANRDSLRRIAPLQGSSSLGYYNLDGYFQPGSQDRTNYTLIMRDAVIEAVWSHVFRHQDKCIPHATVENVLSEFVRSARSFLEDVVDLPYPVCVLVAGRGLRGWRIPNINSIEPLAIDRDILDFPEVVISDGSEDTATALRPIFELLFQAAGVRRAST